MTIDQLHKKLSEIGIDPNNYYLQGQFGSIDDNEKIAFRIFKMGNKITYQVYFKEKGQIAWSNDFYTEADAAQEIFRKLRDEQIFCEIGKTEGLGGMTVNERLFAVGLMDEFEEIVKRDKNRAKQILRWLRVDEPSIELIVK